MTGGLDLETVVLLIFGYLAVLVVLAAVGGAPAALFLFIMSFFVGLGLWLGLSKGVGPSSGRRL